MRPQYALNISPSDSISNVGRLHSTTWLLSFRTAVNTFTIRAWSHIRECRWLTIAWPCWIWGTRSSACMFVTTHYCYWFKLWLCKSVFPDVELHAKPKCGSALPLDENVLFSPLPLPRIEVNGKWIWLDACATVPSEVFGEVFTLIHSVLQFGRESSAELANQPVSQRNRQADRQTLFLAAAWADSPGLAARLQRQEKEVEPGGLSKVHPQRTSLRLQEAQSHLTLAIPPPGPGNHSAILLLCVSCSVFWYPFILTHPHHSLSPFLFLSFSLSHLSFLEEARQM